LVACLACLQLVESPTIFLSRKTIVQGPVNGHNWVHPPFFVGIRIKSLFCVCHLLLLFPILVAWLPARAGFNLTADNSRVGVRGVPLSRTHAFPVEGEDGLPKDWCGLPWLTHVEPITDAPKRNFLGVLPETPVARFPVRVAISILYVAISFIAGELLVSKSKIDSRSTFLDRACNKQDLLCGYWALSLELHRHASAMGDLRPCPSMIRSSAWADAAGNHICPPSGGTSESFEDQCLFILAFHQCSCSFFGFFFPLGRGTP